MATRVIGVDIGTTQVRAAEVELSGKGPGAGGSATLVNFATAPLPAGVVGDGEVLDTAGLAAVLKQLWASAKFSDKQVVVGFGNQRTVLRELELSSMPLAELRSSLPFQVAEMLPMSADEALLDFYPTAEVEVDGAKQLRGILVAASKHAVANAIVAVEAAGLRPIGVDLSAFALLRAQVFGDWAQQVVALVDIGARTTNVVVAQNGMPRFIRVLPSGGAEATDAVASAMKVSLPEAEEYKRRIGIGTEVGPEYQLAKDAIATTTKTLVDAVRNTFVYYAGNNPGAGIQHVVITGGGSHLPGLGQYLASASRLPVSFGDGFSRVKVAKKATTSVAGYETLGAIAVGLGMMEVSS